VALACVIPEHPVGEGSFCRICGRDYVTVPDAHPSALPPETEVPTGAAPTAGAPVVEAPAWEVPVPEQPPAPQPLAVERDTAPTDTASPDTAPFDTAPTDTAAADPAPDVPTGKASWRYAFPIKVAVGSFAGGALAMAVIDRLVA
jgi:hypothetical protein